MKKLYQYVFFKLEWFILILAVLLGLYGFISTVFHDVQDNRKHEIRFLQKSA